MSLDNFYGMFFEQLLCEKALCTTDVSYLGVRLLKNKPLPPTAGILEEGCMTPRAQEVSSWALGCAFCGVPGCCWGPPWPTGRSTAGWFPWVCVA